MPKISRTIGMTSRGEGSQRGGPMVPLSKVATGRHPHTPPFHSSNLHELEITGVDGGGDPGSIEKELPASSQQGFWAGLHPTPLPAAMGTLGLGKSAVGQGELLGELFGGRSLSVYDIKNAAWCEGKRNQWGRDIQAHHWFNIYIIYIDIIYIFDIFHCGNVLDAAMYCILQINCRIQWRREELGKRLAWRRSTPAGGVPVRQGVDVTQALGQRNEVGPEDEVGARASWMGNNQSQLVWEDTDWQLGRPLLPQRQMSR